MQLWAHTYKTKAMKKKTKMTKKKMKMIKMMKG
jgi:hypothetical protein